MGNLPDDLRGVLDEIHAAHEKGGAR